MDQNDIHSGVSDICYEEHEIDVYVNNNYVHIDGDINFLVDVHDAHDNLHCNNEYMLKMMIAGFNNVTGGKSSLK